MAEIPYELTPDILRQLELYRIESRRAVLGSRQGVHASRKRGHGIEFSDYRKYELGDDPRHIDWGVYARSDRLYVKRSQEDQDLTVLLAVDGSASMRSLPDDKKWERACDVALAVGYVTLMARDAVICSVLGGAHSPRFSGGRAYAHLLQLLRNTAPEGSPDLERELQRALSRVRYPGVALWVSDFLFPVAVARTLALLFRSRNLQVIAVQVLGSHDIVPLQSGDAARLVDSESGAELELEMDDETLAEYRVLLADHNQALARVGSRASARWISRSASGNRPSLRSTSPR